MSDPTRQDLEEKITHLGASAARYSQYDQRHANPHREINETLDHWELVIAVDG